MTGKDCKSMLRGLLLTHNIELTDTGMSVFGWVGDERVMNNLLFFDSMSSPNTEMFYFPPSDLLNELSATGILKSRPPNSLGLYDGPIDQVTLQAYMSRLESLNANKDEAWYIDMGPGSLNVPQMKSEGGLTISLLNAVPVPDMIAPLHEVLEFRERRKDEYKRFMHHVDELVLQASSHNFSDLAIRNAINQLDISIADTLKSAKESRFPMRLSLSDISFNVVPYAMTAISSMALGLPLASALLSGIPGSISLSVSAGIRRSQQGGTAAPLSYVSRISKELDGSNNYFYVPPD